MSQSPAILRQPPLFLLRSSSRKRNRHRRADPRTDRAGDLSFPFVSFIISLSLKYRFAIRDEEKSCSIADFWKKGVLIIYRNSTIVLVIVNNYYHLWISCRISYTYILVNSDFMEFFLRNNIRCAILSFPNSRSFSEIKNLCYFFHVPRDTTFSSSGAQIVSPASTPDLL